VTTKAKVIGIANQKGGCGKTTSSINIATGLVSRGYKVLLIDGDPQESSSDWKALSEKNDNLSPAVIGMPRPTIHNEISTFIETFNYIVIDGLSGLNSTSGQITSSTIRASDLVIMPLEPSQLDLWATSEVIGRVKDRKIVTEDRMKACFLLTKCREGTSLKSRVLADIDGQEIPVFKNSLSLREDYKKTIGNGATVFELPIHNKARIEAENLLDEILVILED